MRKINKKMFMPIEHYKTNNYLKKILNAIVDAHGTPYYAGGYVRDQILGIPSKDIDIEVYGLTYDELIKILSNLGIKADLVGKSFGTIKLPNDIELSLPRFDSKVSEGHKGFDVTVDPNMSTKDACRRRDFTINSLLMCPFTGEIIDHYNGVEDLKNGVLHPVDPNTFIDDPLRVIRAVQFIGRFCLLPSYALIDLCSRMRDEIKHLSPDRLRAEWEKWGIKSRNHSGGISFLFDCGLNDLFHIDDMRYLYNSVDISDLSSDQKNVFALSCLCLSSSDPNPILDAMGYTESSDYVKAVRNLITTCSGISYNVDPSEVMYLSEKYHKFNSNRLLSYLHFATGDKKKSIRIYVESLNNNVLDRPMQRLIKGRDLVDLGLTPGPEFGKILEQAADAQRNRLFNTIEGGISYVRNILASACN